MWMDWLIIWENGRRSSFKKETTNRSICDFRLEIGRIYSYVGEVCILRFAVEIFSIFLRYWWVSILIKIYRYIKRNVWTIIAIVNDLNDQHISSLLLIQHIEYWKRIHWTVVWLFQVRNILHIHFWVYLSIEQANQVRERPKHRKSFFVISLPCPLPRIQSNWNDNHLDQSSFSEFETFFFRVTFFSKALQIVERFTTTIAVDLANISTSISMNNSIWSVAIFNITFRTNLVLLLNRSEREISMRSISYSPMMIEQKNMD